jgi:hypothetical protein
VGQGGGRFGALAAKECRVPVGACGGVGVARWSAAYGASLMQRDGQGRPGFSPAPIATGFRMNRSLDLPGKCGEHQRKPLRLIKIMPPKTRRSSIRGLPLLFGKNGYTRSICASVSQERLHIITPVSSGA